MWFSFFFKPKGEELVMLVFFLFLIKGAEWVMLILYPFLIYFEAVKGNLKHEFLPLF